MPYADELRSLAEIAIGLAGFSGIVSALERRSETPAAARQARMRELLLASLGVVFFAFAPALLAGASGTEELAWQAAQLGLVGYQLLLMTIFFRSFGLSQLQHLSRSEWAVTPPSVVVVLVQLASGFGFLAAYRPVIYLLGMVWLLFIATLNFFVLLLEGQRGV